MALRAGYKGFKKLAPGLKLRRPGTIAIDNAALNKTFPTWEDQAVIGVKNILPIKISTLKALNTTGTWVGNAYTLNDVTLTCTVDDAGYVTNIAGSNNTASANITFFLSDTMTFTKEFILSGCPSGGGNSTYKLLLVNAGGSSLGLDEDYGNGVTLQTNDPFRVQLRIYSGQSANNLNFKPMIRLASDSDPTYAPPAMTNKELTDAMFIRNAIANNTDLDNVLDTGVYWDYGNTVVHVPEGISIFVLYVTRLTSKTDANQCVYQTLINTSGASSQIYQRRLGGAPATWSPWYKFTGTELT